MPSGRPWTSGIEPGTFPTLLHCELTLLNACVALKCMHSTLLNACVALPNISEPFFLSDTVLWLESRNVIIFFVILSTVWSPLPREKRVVRAYCLSCSVALWQVRSLLSGRCHGPTQQPSTIASLCSTQNKLPFQESVCVRGWVSGCVRVWDKRFIARDKTNVHLIYLHCISLNIVYY